MPNVRYNFIEHLRNHFIQSNERMTVRIVIHTEGFRSEEKYRYSFHETFRIIGFDLYFANSTICKWITVAND